MESNPYQSPSLDSDRDSAIELAPAANGWKWVAISALAVVALWLVPFSHLVTCIALGWTASRAWPSLTWAICRYLPLIPAVFLGILAITGIARLPHNPSDVHEWSGHLIITPVWLCVPFSLGCLWHQKFKQRPILSVSRSVTLLLCLLMTIWCSFTGYLDTDPYVDEETHNRFVVLHMFLMPAFIAAMLVIWSVTFWPTRKTGQPPTGSL